MTENQRTITIVDDCPEDRETIRSYLQKDQRYTYRIFEASDGENGLVLCKQVKPDVVLLDFLLSDMDALEFINKLKTQLSKTYLPVVVLTSQGDETLALQTIKSGAQEYLGKDNITTGSLCRVIHNLLERTHLLSQIEEREARFRATFEQAAVGIAHVGLDGQWLLVNQKFCDIVGYTREELIARRFQDITHPDDLDTDLDYIRHLLAGEIPTYSIEKRYIHKDGTFVWINLTVSLVRASDGEPLYFISVIQDISDRKQAEEALRESELQLRAIFNGTLDAIAIADDRGRYVDANPAACELFGLSKEDLLNHSVQDFADPGLDFIQVWNSFLLQGQMKGEFSLLRLDGTRREVDFAAAAHFVPHRHLSVLRDISDRKQAQEALRQANDELERRVVQRTAELQQANQELQIMLEELQTAQEELLQQNQELVQAHEEVELERHRYQDLFQEAPDGYLVTDVYGKIQQANRAAATLFSVQQHYLIGKPLHVFIAQQERKTFRTRLAQVQQVQGWEVYLQPRSGNPFPAMLAVTSIKDSQGQQVGLRWLIRDISTPKQMEQQLQAARDELERRVQQRTAELSQSNTLLQEEIRAHQQAEDALQQQVERQRLVTEMAQRIRQSLNTDEILNTTVEEVRQFLQCDRVLIFHFEPDWSGTVIVESVGSEWVSLLSTTLYDPCFAQRYAELSRQGYSSGYEDIYTAGLERCYLELLAHFQVRANLAVPILQGEHLWGLLIAHHCSAPRQWQPLEISLLKQLAMQVGIAIQQSLLFLQAQVEIAERRRVQEALRRERDFSKNLLDSSIDGILAFDCDCRYTLWNSGMERITGVSKQRVLGRTVFEVLPLLQGMVEDRFVLETLAGNRAIASDRPYYIPDTGQSGFFEGYYSPLYAESGEIIGGLGIIRDITKRKLAEQKIRQQAALLDVATDAIFVRSIENQILFWNSGAERLYGWQGAEAFGKNANQLLCKEIPPQLKEALNTVLEKGFWQGELPKVTKSGKDILVASRWTLMRDEAGNAKSILTVDTDITEKKQLEAQFLRTQRLESLGTLASGIAHDLNNMLTPIMMSAQMLLNQPLNERSQKLIQMIETNTKRGADLVKQVLSFTRGVEGKRVPLQIQHLLSEIEQIIRRTFPKSLEIFTNIPTQDLWIVCADATQLHQVFMNLCVNARDAMPNGGILSLSVENTFIDQNYARMHLDAQAGSYLVITVSDTGTGIPPELLERIFDPFFTTKEVGKGTGLGLSTVLGIVKSHGGFINVYSQVGKGSQFKVYLPAMEGTAGQQAEAVELPFGQGELILVVDDEPSIREINKTSLEEHNYQVLTASDGIDAIALYAQHKHNISVVLMDLMMPSMDGSTAIRALKKMNPKVKIIATTGLVANGKFAEATGAGATTFLSKPYTVKELLETLNRVINDLGNG